LFSGKNLDSLAKDNITPNGKDKIKVSIKTDSVIFNPEAIDGVMVSKYSIAVLSKA